MAPFTVEFGRQGKSWMVFPTKLIKNIKTIRLKKKDTEIKQYHLHKAHPEKLQFELYDLSSYRKRSGEKAALPHSHSYYQIIWFFEDGGAHLVDFKTFDLKENTILFISKDQIHAFDDNMEVNGWLIHFNESFFMHSDVDIFLKYNIFNSQQNPCYSIKPKILEVATSYILMIQKELEERQLFGHEEVIRFLLKSFLIILERIHRKTFEEKLEINNPYELQFFKFKELVEENYKKGFSVAHYSGLMNISSKTLSTITNSIVSKSPSQIISDRVVLEAKRLLKFTTFQIGEVAYKIGFEDPSYFVKYFKRFVGQSPSTYRNGFTQ